MTLSTAPNVQQKWASYPDHIKSLLLPLRALILRAAQKYNINDIEETLKWGEPSYTCSTGSTIRIDWKAKQPEQYAMYFNCKTRLIDTFKEIYPNDFQYENNRAIVFSLHKKVPQQALKHCIATTLCYHRFKKKPLYVDYLHSKDH